MTAASLALLALLALLGSSDDTTASSATARSSRWSVELSVSAYEPRIDAEFGGAATPFAEVFGGGRGALYRLDVARSVLRLGGPLEVGVGVGLSHRSGHGRLPSGDVSADTTGFDVYPLRVTLTYRLELLEELSVPLVPYARIGAEGWLWRVTDGAGSTAKSGGHAGDGATYGWSAAAGIALVLDGLDSSITSSGRRTSLFVEVSRNGVNDFGSRNSWDLSSQGLLVGGGLQLSF